MWLNCVFLGVLRIRRSDKIKKTVPGARHEELGKKTHSLAKSIVQTLGDMVAAY